MPAKNVTSVRRKMRAIFDKLRGPMSERTLTEVLIIGDGYAAAMTPVDTSNLINSRFRFIEHTASGLKGRVGYTAAYAAAVHAAKGTLKGQDRPSNRGKYWGPDGEPQFLEKGFERDGLADIKAAIKRGMQV